MVCDDKIACRAIDEELEKHMSYAALARLMTLRGFSVSDGTLSQHDKHRRPSAPPGVAKTKRDFAILVRDRVATAVENLEPDEDGADPILLKDFQPAIKSGLAAQGLIDKREARTDDKKAVFQLAILLAGGPAGLLAPPDLTGEDEVDDENVIEGEAVEVES
jgi:hypothetical protein